MNESDLLLPRVSFPGERVVFRMPREKPFDTVLAIIGACVLTIVLVSAAGAFL